MGTGDWLPYCCYCFGVVAMNSGILSKIYADKIKQGEVTSTNLGLSQYISYGHKEYPHQIMVYLNLNGIVATAETNRLAYLVERAYDAWEKLIDEGNVG